MEYTQSKPFWCVQHVAVIYLSRYIINSNMNENGGLLHTLQVHMPIT